jgi:predicted secreted protein with PEFG-CTERM motif
MSNIIPLLLIVVMTFSGAVPAFDSYATTQYPASIYSGVASSSPIFQAPITETTEKQPLDATLPYPAGPSNTCGANQKLVNGTCFALCTGPNTPQGCVIPEFGPIASLVLVISVVSIVALSAKTRLRLIPS